MTSSNDKPVIEIEAPRRLVWLNCFANEHCGIARAPSSDYCAVEEERVFFDELRPSREQGYGGTFSQLVDYLAED